MKYNNPIIRGFHPDPSICRVEEDYYLATSSFEYFPGIPVFHSRNLTHWKQIGNCVPHAADMLPGNAGLYSTEQGANKQENLFRPQSLGKPGSNLSAHIHDSGGIWAPTIRYEKGLYYVTATLDGYGNFITHASNPAGPWSKPIWVPVGGIDPSLFFENGRAYYCTNQSLHSGQEEITLCEVDPETGKLLSGQRTLWNGIGGGFLEGPHLYHINEFYYLLAAEGGTSFNHMITLARSHSLWGPYEGCPWNPILTNVHDTSKQVQCSGHGDLLKDHLGNFWLVHLATRLSRRTMTHLGRETFLTPVRWVDGWLCADNHKKATLECEGPLWLDTKSKTISDTEKRKENINIWKANFNKPEWEAEWIFLRDYDASSYQRGDGTLNLYPAPISLSDKFRSPTFAAVRQPDFNFELVTAFTFSASRIGDEAGLALRLSSDFYYCFCIQRQEDGIFLCVRRKIEDIWYTDCRIPLENSSLHLKVQGCRESYLFSYAPGAFQNKEAANYQTAAMLSTRFLSTDLAGRCFTGTVTGLYTLCTEKTSAVMKVKQFCIRTIK